MKAIVVLFIALTCCQISEGKESKLPKIEIDILAKESTEQLTITPVKDGDITTYPFVPKVEYKKITLKYEKNVVFEIKKDEFISFEVIWYNKFKNGVEPLILVLKYIDKKAEKESRYYKFSDGWKGMKVAFYDYLCTVMKEGKEIGEDPIQEYREWKKEQEEGPDNQGQTSEDKKDVNTTTTDKEDQKDVNQSPPDNQGQSTEDTKKGENTTTTDKEDQKDVNQSPPDNQGQSTGDDKKEDNKTTTDTQNADNTTPGDDKTDEAVVNEVTHVALDVNTRNGTDQVNVTKIEDGNMVIYKIEPKNKCKIGKFVDADKVILEPKEDEDFLYLEVKCINTDVNDVILTTLVRSHEGSDTLSLNYYRLEDNWIEVTDQFCSFLIVTMKSGIVYSNKIVAKAYENHVNESNKNKVEIDISNKDSIPAGVTMKNAKEFGVDVSVYGVDESVISKIMYGSSTIWSKKDDIYGCYEVRVYYSERTPTFFKLLIKNVRDTELLYIKNIQQNMYSLIAKEDFDKGMEQLKSDKSVELSLTNDKNTTNNQPSSNINQSGTCDAIKRFFGVETSLVIDIRTNKIAGIKFNQYDMGDIITYKFTCMPKFGITKILSRGALIWESKDDKYRCYDISIDKIGENVVVLRLFLKHKSDSKELYFEKVDSKFISIDRMTYYVRFINANNVQNV